MVWYSKYDAQIYMYIAFFHTHPSPFLSFFLSCLSSKERNSQHEPSHHIKGTLRFASVASVRFFLFFCLFGSGQQKAAMRQRQLFFSVRCMGLGHTQLCISLSFPIYISVSVSTSIYIYKYMYMCVCVTEQLSLCERKI